jgi:hypothetical protein
MGVGDSDLAVFFQDGDLVTVTGGGQFMGHLDIPEVLDAFSPLGAKAGEVRGNLSLRFATGQAPSLAHGTQLTVKGTTYKVRSVRKEGDGQVSNAELALP